MLAIGCWHHKQLVEVSSQASTKLCAQSWGRMSRLFEAPPSASANDPPDITTVHTKPCKDERREATKAQMALIKRYGLNLPFGTQARVMVFETSTLRQCKCRNAWKATKHYPELAHTAGNVEQGCAVDPVLPT